MLDFYGVGTLKAPQTTSLDDHLARFDCTVDVSRANSAPLKSSVEYSRWSAVSLMFCRATPLTITWPQVDNQEHCRDFRFFRISSGEYRVVCQETSQRFGSKDIALLPNGAAIKLVIDQPSSFTLMSVPRELLPSATRSLDRKPFYKIDSENQAICLLAAYQDFLRGKKPSPDLTLSQKVGQHLVDLMSVSLASMVDELSAAHRAGRDAWLGTIKSDIQSNLAQVRLSAKTAARRYGVTDRYIHKLFEETGETFGRYVTEQRLNRAYALLTTPHYTMPISTIALEVGFGELSTFNRAFKRRFGDTPSIVRRRHSADQCVHAGERNSPR